jgi:hypothetical protein
MFLVFRGSALAAATNGDTKIGKDAILALMDAVSCHLYVSKKMYFVLMFYLFIRFIIIMMF